MSLESPNNNKSIPPPFTELAMPSAEYYYDLSDPEVVMETFPHYRELFYYILASSENPKQAASLMLEQLGWAGETIAAVDEVQKFRKKLELVSALNSGQQREGDNCLKILT
jgi:hypothetical protein